MNNDSTDAQGAVLLVPCQKCFHPVTLTAEAKRDWRPGSIVRHVTCPGEPPANAGHSMYELDLVIRVRPIVATDASLSEKVPYDDAVTMGDILARVTERVDAPDAGTALMSLLPKTSPMWERINQLAPLADATRMTEEVLTDGGTEPGQ